MKNRIAITALNFLRACAVPIATLVAVSLVARTPPYDSTKPLPHTTVFAPGIISTGDDESHATFSVDGREQGAKSKKPKSELKIEDIGRLPFG